MSTKGTIEKTGASLTLPVFLEFIEIKTKLASLFPMLVGFVWTGVHYGRFNWLNAGILFIAVTFFDMTTTAINNTMDFHKAKDEEYKFGQNVIGRMQLDYSMMVKIVLSLLAGAFIFSIVLVFLTDYLLLAIGAICYFIGILYTFGPVPISRTPFGEVLSGLTMGFGIFYLAVFVTMYPTFLMSDWSMATVVIQLDWYNTLLTFFMSLPFVILISNIMLANNTCDLETDRLNERYTLVHYIGKTQAVFLYQVLSAIPWILWLLYIVLGLLPLWAAIMFLVAIPHYRSVQRFKAKQVKAETFVEAVKSFSLFSFMYLVTLVIDLFI